MRAAEPPRPEALRWREGDFPRTGFGTGLSDREDDGVRWYGGRAAGWMRDKPAAAWFPGRHGPLGAADEARRVGILAAWDAWRAEVERLEVDMGLTAVDDACSAAGAAYWPARSAVESWTPRTLDGLRAKARWVLAYAGKDAVGDDAALAFARQVAAFGEAGA